MEQLRSGYNYGVGIIQACARAALPPATWTLWRAIYGGQPPAEFTRVLRVRRAPTETSLRARWHGPYLEGEVPLDPWGNPYQYSPTGHELNAITLYSYGPTGKPGGEAVGYLPTG